MNEVLNIQWYTGHMNIYMPAFFPCPMTKYKKLLQVIQMDWEHEDEILRAMQKFFQEQITAQETAYQENCKRYWHYQQKEADMRSILENGKYPNGVRITKQRMKDGKEFLKNYAAEKRAAERAAKQAKKNKEWFEGRVNDGR